MLALGGHTTNPLYNVPISAQIGLDLISRSLKLICGVQWFIGRELNPRVGTFDIKTFNEMRPGLILWFLIDISMAAKQYVEIGKLSSFAGSTSDLKPGPQHASGRITDSMVLVVTFQSFYVFDALYFEVLGIPPFPI
jgi:Ergosterol biosynthesis ERG4/ERG24 family